MGAYKYCSCVAIIDNFQDQLEAKPEYNVKVLSQIFFKLQSINWLSLPEAENNLDV